MSDGGPMVTYLQKLPEPRRGTEIIGGPLDGCESDVPLGANAFEDKGHLYVLAADDTGARYWDYRGYALVGPKA